MQLRVYQVRMRLQDSEDPSNSQEVVSSGTSAGLKHRKVTIQCDVTSWTQMFESHLQTGRLTQKGTKLMIYPIIWLMNSLEIKLPSSQLTSWPKSSNSDSSEQAASRYSDSKASRERTTVTLKTDLNKYKYWVESGSQLTSQSIRDPVFCVGCSGSHITASSILEARAPLEVRNKIIL